MPVLGIETSGRGGSIAVVSDGAVIAERQLPTTGRRHARLLVPELRDLLRGANLTATQLKTVAVSIGPGSFTGLRVGVVCAKTLAYALQIPVVAVDTFLAIAEELPAEVREVAILDDALRGELFVGHYRRRDDGWEIERTPALISAELWLAEQQARPLSTTGPGLTKWAETLRPHVPLLDTRSWEAQARAIARLGEQQHHAGEHASLVELEPFYIRRSYAEENAAS
ncbi:MAG: tRNA (adenosine(37)-N6)-threonylcarbamoyltransferase complex dimerization subunit type 1 TsaB [Planctomycetaceae bacterium]|nr:tRNA (adenosine(37)-N6)-threonylcarbamoyltransferase complex dimerization subunit type 1 TsaB [Planctomycetaceae bacterium]